jgi:flagellar L-ring protein precursor FlgH
MKTIHATLVALVALSAQAQNPGSLWDDSAKNPLTDRTARGVGDILTVIIAESSSATSSASTESSKADSAKVNAGIGPVLRALIPDWEIGGSMSSKGDGKTSRTGRLSARLTVVVKERLPNGNLVIEGVRHVQVNKEIQKFVLTGVVRPDDIRSDNTILSEFIANAEIRYEGSGTVGDRQRKGILTTLLDWLF